MYGRCTVFTVRVNASIPHVMRIIDFTIFYFWLQSSLAFNIARGCPQSSAAARISRPSTTAAPTLQATAHLAPTITFFFYSLVIRCFIVNASLPGRLAAKGGLDKKQAQHYLEVLFQICILKPKICLFMC
jgi:hypothetical protein